LGRSSDGIKGKGKDKAEKFLIRRDGTVPALSIVKDAFGFHPVRPYDAAIRPVAGTGAGKNFQKVSFFL
jgi:hypothetical protein